MDNAQQEYIADSELLSALADYFNAAINGEEDKSKLNRLWDIQMQIIRSHPTPSPHKTDMFFAPLLNCDCEVCKDAREAHDTTIRNATLDDVSNLILDAMNERSFTDTDGDYFQCSQLSKDEIDMVIQSLRTQEPHP